ncbi:MAG: hypothetical protein OHK0024_35470 [Thalassobaculales bacterium]
MIRLLDRAVGTIAAAAAAVAGVLTLVMAVLVGYGVVMRYVLGQPQNWTDELVGYLTVAAVMLAAADVLRRREHIAVDVLTERLGAPARRWSEMLGLVAVATFCALLIAGGWEMMAFSHMIGMRSTGTLAMPMWIPQAFVPGGAALLGLAALARLARLLAAGRE